MNDLNKNLIRERGKAIIQQLKQQVEKSTLVLINEDARTHISKQAKRLVDADRANLTAREKDILLRYVQDGILGTNDPDRMLHLLTSSAAGYSNPTLQEPAGSSIQIASDMESSRQKLKDRATTWQNARTLGQIVIMIVAFVCTLVARGHKNNSSERSLHHFSQSFSVNVNQSDQIDYGLDIPNQNYYVYVPANYTGKSPFGLVVYIAPTDDWSQLPAGWAQVLAQHHLLLIAPQAAGNSCRQNRRMGLGVLGALAAMQEYKIDRSRVYAAGLSGGARTAGDMAFYQPDLFSGTVQDCGADFYHSVEHAHGTNWIDSNGNPYGVIDVPAAAVRAAKDAVRFVLITGANDFRHGNLLDLYDNGYNHEGFKCKFIDVPGMGHQDCSGETFAQALSYIEGESKPASK
jgi:hypothetical protein